MRRTLPLSLTAAAMAVVAIPGASAVEAPSAVRWGDCPKDAALPGLECSTLKVPLDQQNERDPGTPLVAARKLRQAFGELARWSRPTRAARRLPVRQEPVRERRGDQLPDHGRAALARPRLRGGDPLITSPWPRSADRTSPRADARHSPPSRGDGVVSGTRWSVRRCRPGAAAVRARHAEYSKASAMDEAKESRNTTQDADPPRRRNGQPGWRPRISVPLHLRLSARPQRVRVAIEYQPAEGLGHNDGQRTLGR